MPMNTDIRGWLSQIAQLQGANLSNKEWGQNIDEAASRPWMQQLYNSGRTPQQVYDNIIMNSGRQYQDASTALLAPFQSENFGNPYTETGQIDPAWATNHPDAAASLQSGKVVRDNQGQWAVAPGAVPGSPRPANEAGVDFWRNSGSLNDPNKVALSPDQGLVTSLSNVKQSRGEPILNALGNILPLLLLSPALGAVMPGLSSLVGLGSKTAGGGKPGAGDLLSLLKMFGSGG